METLLPIRRRASQHPRRANRSPRGTRPSCKLTARPCAASVKIAIASFPDPNKNPQPRFNRNQQYSITAVSNGGGSVVERYAYSQVTIFDDSGSQISDSAISNRYTFTGREWDDGLSLYHYRARMYDAVGGRFVSRDLIGFADGYSLHRGYFVSNATDPEGKIVPILIGVGVGIGIILTPGVANSPAPGDPTFVAPGDELENAVIGGVIGGTIGVTIVAGPRIVECVKECRNARQIKKYYEDLKSLQDQLRGLADRKRFWEQTRDFCQQGSQGHMQALRAIETIEATQARLLQEIANVTAKIAQSCL